jgi:hypothetical protein
MLKWLSQKSIKYNQLKISHLNYILD